MSTLTKDKIIAAMTSTGNPKAPIYLQETYNNLDSIGRMFAKIADKDNVTAVTSRLLESFPDNELNELSGSPEFIMALCSLLSSALLSYGRRL